MNDKTCGTCKYRGEPITHEWWDEKKDDMVTRQTYFLCALIKHINGEYGERDYMPGLGAGVIDGSGYHAALCVESDFGCNRYEAASQSDTEERK